MKNSVRQTVLSVICILIVFIPTYIAIAYFNVKNDSSASGRYEIDIVAHTGERIAVGESEVDTVARAVLKMNSKLSEISNFNASLLPQKYYDIKVSDNGTVSDYRYYFSTGEGERTVVSDRSDHFYYLEYKHVKSFLSRPCAYSFYENAIPPILSIYGGKDVLPQSAEWKYRAVNGTMVELPSYKTGSANDVYDMSSSTKLSFNVKPDKCTVRVFNNKSEILKASSLDNIPYELLDTASLYFEISAEWTSSGEYRGRAEYKFTSSIGKDPEFFINKTDIASGELVAVTALNVSAPNKIEFSSVPSIGFTPVFFTEGDKAIALIPINKELPAPMTYTFRFSYGNSVSELTLHVEERDILERSYNCNSISVSRTEENLAAYEKLLNDIGSKCESVRYFDDRFIAFDTYYPGVSNILLGFGHVRIPNTSDEPFRLDGVDYELVLGVDVPAVAAGKVVYSGSDPLLGNFIVVDHGFGLKTWYCNVNECIAPVGTTVTKGEVICKAGSTGYSSTSGVYLITTVMDIPVSPYPIQEEGIVFHTPSN